MENEKDLNQSTTQQKSVKATLLEQTLREMGLDFKPIHRHRGDGLDNPETKPEK
ncbi:MAG: hypothetical protein ACI4TM_03090 [Candidatus Cryptobacteroides sp.]